MINTTLRLSLGMFANVTIEDKHTNEANEQTSNTTTAGRTWVP